MKIGIIAAALAFVGLSAVAQTNQKTNMDMKKLELVQEWDKTFPKSDKVEHSKVVFVNRFGVTLAADMYVPKEVVGKLSAVAVSGPFGAVKEQSSGLYAQALAERGFLTIAFDPSFTGESGGVPRNVASPDINTEDFSAAVDFLANEDRVDPERIGILGICGWGGFAINAAANDTRIKATVASTMYDISRCTANGYFDQADNADARYEMRRRLNAQRTEDYRNGSYVRAGGGGRSGSGRCAAVCTRLSCLLQNFPRLSRPFAQFHAGVECDLQPRFFECTYPCLCRRDSQCSDGGTR